MQYILKKPYSGVIVSGEHVNFSAGDVFDTFDDFIVKDDLTVCRINSQFFKEYFTDELADEVPTYTTAAAVAVASDTLPQLAMTSNV